jgi:glycosyltransferase involved in cell wall biosynthesis
MEEVRNADFSILFRPKRRYSEAGFPTKVVESLSVGTALLCNLSSDLGEYLNHGKEALIYSDVTVPAITTRLEEAIALGPVDLDDMRICARNCAEEHFDVRTYVAPLRRFLAAVCQ